MGAIYISNLNLPREHQYKRENILLVGLIPGPHEPQRNINTFIKPLVNDLLKFWAGIEMYIASSNYRKVIRCAVLCVACDLPAGRKLCGFLGHSARLRCSRCLKEFLDRLVAWTILGLIDTTGDLGLLRNTKKMPWQ